MMRGIKKPTDLIYNKTKEPLIGGPGTMLPFAVESFLSWSLAIACLSVSGYHYLIATFLKPTISRLWAALSIFFSDSQQKDSYDLPCWLPLTTSSRDEYDRLNPDERSQQLIAYLQHVSDKKTGWSNEELVRIIRQSDSARRLASLALRPTGSSVKMHGSEELRKQLVEIWNELLVLPEPPSHDDFDFQVSIILPTYRERGTDVRIKLTRAFESCSNPKQIEVIVVNAGECVALKEEVQNMECWGSLRILDFVEGGGRGPCLNFGANAASGRLYTFCHSDTTLPPNWDEKVIRALDETPNGIRANSCAFSFGIDTSEVGLNGEPYPPGVKAIDATANIRTHLYSLPYGDQALSVPATVFDYIGGFPDQCLMEDYEIISLLRRRNALMPKLGIQERERLVIIGGIPALCSPRRWQKFGVLFVTYMNSKFVNLYAGGLSPNGLFQLYYGRPAPERNNLLSPWELELNRVLTKEA